jgi:hypothetical protein
MVARAAAPTETYQDINDPLFDIFDPRRAPWQRDWGQKCPTPSCTFPGPTNGNYCSRCKRVYNNLSDADKRKVPA